MAGRRDRDDDSGEFERPAPTNKGTLYIVLIVLGVVLVGCLGTTAAVVAGWFTAVNQDVQQNAIFPVNADPKTKVWGEQELADAVKGKTANEVKELLGKPYSTSGDPDKNSGAVSWRYKDRLTDPHAGNATDAWVRFESGKATGVVR